MKNIRGHGGRASNLDFSNETKVAVAIDKDKSSQVALKWTLDNLVTRGQSLLLLHVKRSNINNNESYPKDVFLPFRCFCTRKEVRCVDVVLEGGDIPSSIVEYITQNGIDMLVLGAVSRSGFARFKSGDNPSCISKGAPDFCTVYIISKGKISSIRKALRPAPFVPNHRTHKHNQPPQPQITKQAPEPQRTTNKYRQHHHYYTESESAISQPIEDTNTMISPYTKAELRRARMKSYEDFALTESDLSFVTSSDRSSTDKIFPSLFNDIDGNRPPRFSNMTNADGFGYESAINNPLNLPNNNQIMFKDSNVFPKDDDSFDNSMPSSSAWLSQNTMDDTEAEMKRLRLELKHTMDMYNSACKEAVNAKLKSEELHNWKIKEQRRIEEGKMSKMSIVQQRRPGQGTMGKEMGTGMDRNPPRVVEKKLERTKNKGATEGGIADGVRKKRMIPMSSFEMKALNRYKRYSIDEIEKATDYFSADRKIGEGGYGPVYKCFLDQTAVAIKTLRLDAAQGRSQFQQEIEVLGGMRHPNMVLLLGACPEHGCLVYEYMSNGSLEEQLFPRNKKTPPIILPLPWQLRFRISAEICTALLFLHQTKPKPLVHRDLKPANILLDSNYVSKISDVGLARIVPANNSPTATSTQYHMTSAAGTFCYIDPEYQQTGLLGVKSDVYSLGILLLQVITGKQPMGLTHHVEAAIENDVFEDILDPAVKDWPIQQALQFAQMALQCAELRRKDRPDLGTEVLPLMNKLRAFADDHHLTYDDVTQDVISDRMSEQESQSSMSSTNTENRILISEL